MKKSINVWLVFILLLLSGWVGSQNAPALLFYADSDGKLKPVKTKTDWQRKRRQILEGMEKAMGPLPARYPTATFNLKISDSLQTEFYTRYNIRLQVTENERLPALLYIPKYKPKNKKLPAMLVLHGTGNYGKQLVDDKSTRPGRHQAKELAQRGYVVIAPDYPSFGDLLEYDFTKDRYESGTMKGIVNHMRCVDFLQGRKEVDPDRIGVLGHSLGGHNAMFVAAFDPRLKVVVSSCGWTPFPYYNAGEEVTKKYGGKLGPWAQDRYMPFIRDKYKLDYNLIPFSFEGVIAALAPRAFFSNSPLNDTNFDVNGVKKGVEAASKVYQFFYATDKLQVRYPNAGHDFPTETRMQAYQFIDKTLKHTPNPQVLE